MQALNKILEQNSNNTKAEGSSYIFQWSPDLSTEEILNIGVGFRDIRSGEFDVKILDYFERIQCLYGQGALFNLQLACNVAEQLISQSNLSDFIQLTPQIRFKKRGYAQGESIDKVLMSLYEDLIPLGAEIRKKVSNKFSSISTDKLYLSLKSELKKKLDLSYSLHVPDSPYTSINYMGKEHQVYLPYDRENGVATLVSTVYSDIQRVKGNLFDSYKHIDIARSKTNKKENAVFILLPDDTLKGTTQIDIENQVDEFTWLLNQHKIKVESNVNVCNLANDIANWCTNAA
jgi:hypothetical protein